jgi:3-hydroxybutyryl-CoA dehydrogenase
MKQRLVHARFIGDLLHPRAVRAAQEKDFVRGVEDPLAAPVVRPFVVPAFTAWFNHVVKVRFDHGGSSRPVFGRRIGVTCPAQARFAIRSAAMIRQITVLGTGTMGRGIAYLAAVAGYETVMFDVETTALDAAKTSIEAILRKGVDKGKLDPSTAISAFGKLQLIAELEPAVSGADLIIEAVPEILDLKIDLFAQADLFCGPDTILASNTSSISISKLAANVERRDRFVGMHFFNPPHAMKLIEIVRGERTSDETIEQTREVAEKMDKTPIIVRDWPGFATSRLGVAIGLEAIRMFEEGVASAEDIDRAMELGYNHPMGPLRLTDLVGLDVRLGIAEYLSSTLGPRFEPPQLLRDMVAEGKLGKKSGEGFYRWPAE